MCEALWEELPCAKTKSQSGMIKVKKHQKICRITASYSHYKIISVQANLGKIKFAKNVLEKILQLNF